MVSLYLGAVSLNSLAGVYRPIDIALTETPESFRSWLFEAASGGEASAGELRDRVAFRLLSMPLEQRRAVAVALTRRTFWSPQVQPDRPARDMQAALRGGILEALRQASMSGDLYFAAAWLEIRLDGFGSRGRALLRSSHLFAPRELPFVLERLSLAPLLWPLLQPEERSMMKGDLETLRAVQPDRAREIEAMLAQEGVTFP